MDVQFREAEERDLAAVVALLEDDDLGKTREGGSLEPYIAALRDMRAQGGFNRLIVGETGGEVVATYQLTIIPGISLSAARRAQVEGVRVAARMRGQGVGNAMFADAEARARSAGCRLLQLTMNASRTDSARFYERLGFIPSHIGYKRQL